MIIGVPREIKTHDYRVGMVPEGVRVLTRAGHTVLLEKDAGSAAGYSNDEYVHSGARLISSPADIWGEAELVVKVKEPQPAEYDLMQKNQILFCYLHLAPVPELTRTLMDRCINAVALETIQYEDGHLPCLMPMSEIAGRMAIHIGIRYLMHDCGGPGILLEGVPGVPPCEVLVLGAGVVGINAARVAANLGAHVRIMDTNLSRLAYIDEAFDGRISTVMSNDHNIEKFVPEAQLLIGAVLVPGGRTPVLVSRELVSEMREGSVIVDIAVDQGGCVETTRPTTHDDPVYTVSGVTHYCVENIPGAVQRTSTQALTNATLPFVIKIANEGLEKAAAKDSALKLGINIFVPKDGGKGVITCKPVADSLGESYVPIDETACLKK